MDPPKPPVLKVNQRRKLCRANKRQQSIRDWLSTAADGVDAKPEASADWTVPLWRCPSDEDDLDLGVEASLYGRQGVKTVQEFLRSTHSSLASSRWTSFSSAGAAPTPPVSVMDVLNMWMDDPEELLLDLGFGCDEPDISGRIPARFINSPSQARGINIQVFMDAHKSRLDLENPDVSNRFRQLEVLHQVTTAFSALVGGAGPTKAPGSAPAQNLPAEAQERRRRVGLLLRRASKMSLNPDPVGAADEQAPPSSLKGGKRAGGLSPLAEEEALPGRGAAESPFPPQAPSDLQVQDGAVRLEPLKEGQPLDTSGSKRRWTPGKGRESFELEEVQSFDEGSVVSGVEKTVWGRTNSTQSDSSGFLEEPFIPSHPPAPELIKTLAFMSEGSTESQATVRENPSPPASPGTHHPPSHRLSPPPSSVGPPDSTPHETAIRPSPAAASPPPPVRLPSSPDRPAAEGTPGQGVPPGAGAGLDPASGPGLAATSLSPGSEGSTRSPGLTPTSPHSPVSPLCLTRPAAHEVPTLGSLGEEPQEGEGSPGQEPRVGEGSPGQEPRGGEVSPGQEPRGGEGSPGEEPNRGSIEEPHDWNRGNGALEEGLQGAKVSREQEQHRGVGSLEEPHGRNRGVGSLLEEPEAGKGSVVEERHGGDGSLEEEPHVRAGSLEEPHKFNRENGSLVEEPYAGKGSLEEEPEAGKGSLVEEPEAGKRSVVEERHGGDGSLEEEPHIRAGSLEGPHKLNRENGSLVEESAAGKGSLVEEPEAGKGSLEEEPEAGKGSLVEEPEAEKGSLVEEPEAGKGSVVEERHGGDGSLEEEPHIRAGSLKGPQEWNRGNSSLVEEPEGGEGSLEEEPGGGDGGSKTSASAPRPSPPQNTHIGEPGPGSFLLPPSGSEDRSPDRLQSAVPPTRPDHQTTNALGRTVPEDENAAPPVRGVVPGEGPPSGSGGPERVSPRPHGADEEGQDGPGVRSGPDGCSVPRTWSGGRFRQTEEGKQAKSGVSPLVAEPEDELILTGSGGFSQGVASESRQCEKERSGRCLRFVETNLDEVESALSQDRSGRFPEAPAGETRTSRRFKGVLETDLDEMEYTEPGPGHAPHFEILVGESRLSRKLLKILETDIDALESAVAEGATETLIAPQDPAPRVGLLETHIDDPALSVYTGRAGTPPDGWGRLTQHPAGPIAVDSLEDVFETSLDSSLCDGEYGDVDAIFQELDSDGRVYWAEPIRVSSASPAPSQSEGSQGSRPASPDGLAGLESSSSPDHPKVPGPPETDPALRAGPTRGSGYRSVSVQMPSCEWRRSVSHIVKRQDVPLDVARPSASGLMSASLPCLDTSTPLRAVQSWTDLQLRRKGLGTAPWGGFQVSQSQGSLRVGMGEEAPAPSLSPAVFSSDPTLGAGSTGRWSTDSLPESPGSFRSNSVSLDTELWPEEGDAGAGKETDGPEDALWEGSPGGAGDCCCSCDRQHTCGQTYLRRQPSAQSIPYSQEELEGMIFCLRRFRVVLANIEDQVSEEQASVFGALSDSLREEACDITALRSAVKQEAGELELQLRDLQHHYDESLQMKMQRLLNEQSLLCSQLRLGAPLDAAPVRSVSTQCCLPPVSAAGWRGDTRLAPDPDPSDPDPDRRHHPDCLVIDSPTLGCATTKSDKLDFVGFLQRLKESLRPSVTSESLE